MIAILFISVDDLHGDLQLSLLLFLDRSYTMNTKVQKKYFAIIMVYYNLLQQH